MSTELVLSLLALLVSIVSVGVAGGSMRQAQRSANAAEAQVAGQRESNIAAAQPYVWADVRGDDAQGQRLVLLVGNSGPTVAENVRVNFDPPLPRSGDLKDLTSAALDRLQDGFSSVAPGHVHSWPLGLAAELLRSPDAQIHTVTVDADGPFGAVPSLTYVINLSDFRESTDSPSGTIHKLTKAVDRVSAEIKKLH